MPGRCPPAINAAGEPLGRVIAIHFGAGDIIEIAPPRGSTMLLPFTNAAVPTADLGAGRVVIELPNEIAGDDNQSRLMTRQPNQRHGRT
jgi:16S rRNA processing protein RimM